MHLFQLGRVMLIMPVIVVMSVVLMIQPAIAAMECHQELAPGIKAGHAG